MSNYQREEYEKKFARLLNKALRKGKNDPGRALSWLNKRSKLQFAWMLTSKRIEAVDAYLDVREHLEKRLLTNRGKSEKLENDGVK